MTWHFSEWTPWPLRPTRVSAFLSSAFSQRDPLGEWKEREGESVTSVFFSCNPPCLLCCPYTPLYATTPASHLLIPPLFFSLSLKTGPGARFPNQMDLMKLVRERYLLFAQCVESKPGQEPKHPYLYPQPAVAAAHH